MKGRLPGARCNSFNIYGAGTSMGQAPSSMDAATVPIDQDGTFTLIITQDDINTTKKALENHPECKGDKVSYLVANKQWKMGFFAMRNYLVHPGSAILSPEIRRIADNSLVRASERLIAGPAGLVGIHSPLIRTLTRMLTLHFIVFFLFHYFEVTLSVLNLNGCTEALQGSGVAKCWTQGLVGLISLSQPFERLCYVCCCSMLIAYLIIQLLYNSGRKGLKGVIMPMCKNTYNKFIHSSIEQGSEVSQPSQLHQYWMCPIELKNNEALQIQMNINPDFQKYWSIVVYDEYGLCLPQYVHDHLYLSNVDCNDAVTNGTEVNEACNPAGKMVSGRWEDNWKGKMTSGVHRRAPYKATILLTNTKRSLVSNTSKDTLCVDISDTRSGLFSSTCKGYVLFRLVHPSTNPDTAHNMTSNGKAIPLKDIIEFSAPQTTIVHL